MERQIINIEYCKRFSMCNCLTLFYPETYTAHTMTMDYFIKMVTPGAHLTVPHANLLPEGYIRTYKISKTAEVFLFSPFNEAFLQSYHIGSDGLRYAMPKYTYLGLDNLMREIPRLTPDEFRNSLLKMDKKVTSMWGNILKILVFYDSTNADESGPGTKARLDLYNSLTYETLHWPIVQVNALGAPKREHWFHYANCVLADTLNSITQAETSLRQQRSLVQ